MFTSINQVKINQFQNELTFSSSKNVLNWDKTTCLALIYIFYYYKVYFFNGFRFSTQNYQMKYKEDNLLIVWFVFINLGKRLKFDVKIIFLFIWDISQAKHDWGWAECYWLMVSRLVEQTPAAVGRLSVTGGTTPNTADLNTYRELSGYLSVTHFLKCQVAKGFANLQCKHIFI